MKKNLYTFIILCLLCGSSCSKFMFNSPFNSRADGGPFPETDISGSDALSSSTNRSDRAKDTAANPDPLAGSLYVKAPSIGNYGTVNLQVPINVPAGRAGMNPSVGLSYSSSSGDGLCGTGWSLLTGLGAISRTTAHGELYYDSRDIFTFNGSRMVKVAPRPLPADSATRLPPWASTKCLAMVRPIPEPDSRPVERRPGTR